MLLDKKIFFVKEQVQMMKLSGTYDIFDPETSNQIGVAKEEPGGLIKFFRFFISKKILPNQVNVYDLQDQNIAFFIKKPSSLFRSKVLVHKGNGELIGYFKSKVLTVGGGFYVYDTNDRQVAEVKGNWKGWNFKFIDNEEKEIGTVTKKWAGAGKELFTSADNYMISINNTEKPGNEETILLLAAGLAIDTVYKEK